MKTLKLTLLLLTATTLIKGQGVWSPPGATWHYSYDNFSVTGYIEIKYIGDSLVGGKMTKMLQKVKHWYDYSTTNSGIDILGYEFTYLSNDTVYYYRFGQFYVLYDFNSSPSDYWTIAGWGKPGSCDSIGEIKVDSIGTTTINTFTLKYLKISSKDTSDWQFGSTLVERIGCTDYYMFPEPLLCIFDVDEGGPFRCYYDSTFGLYQSGITTACDFITGIESLATDNKGITVYPNPTTTEITIDLRNSLGQRNEIDLYSILGHKIKTIETDEKKIKIDISDLTDGVYFVVIKDEHDKQWIRKMIFNTP